MIYRHKIISALENKLADFNKYDQVFVEERDSYDEALQSLFGLSQTELTARLDKAGPSPGALPTVDFERAVNGVIRFPYQFNNHEEARVWALDTLLDRVTFAADGSQIMPTKDFSVPVAVVQVGWFENWHSREGRYIKDTRLEVLTPKDLMTQTGADRQVSEGAVSLRRFQLETQRLQEYMLAVAKPESRAPDALSRNWPLVFFDNTLVVSFAEMFRERRAQYVRPVVEMLRASQQTRVPLVGYVDTTFARDLTNMLQASFGLNAAERMHDALLLDMSGNLQWGDRTPFYICAREGILDEYQDAQGDLSRQLGFLYMRTNAGLPARIDVPLWIYEAGLLDQILDLVRAEVIVGNGYPYAIATADAVTTISQADRDVFYGIFQQFTKQQNIRLRVSRKALSKTQRR